MTDNRKKIRSLPDVAVVRTGIAKLNALDLNHTSFEELRNQTEELIGFTPSSWASIDVGTKVFRARTNESADRGFGFPVDLYMPPKALTVEYGRANQPNAPILYTSTNLRLASYEVLNQRLRATQASHLDATITIGVWTVRERLTLANIIHHGTLQSSKPYRALCSQYIDVCRSDNLHPEDIESDREVCKFFCGHFIREDIKTHHDYKFSVLYTHLIEERFDGFYDGVNYPSVACRYSGDNQAIFAASAEKKLEYDGCFEIACRVFSEHEDDFIFVLLGEGFGSFEEKIEWKQNDYDRKNIHDLERFVSDNDLIDRFTVIK